MPVTLIEEDKSIDNATLCYEKYKDKAFWDSSENKCYNIGDWKKLRRTSITISPSSNEEVIGIFSKRDGKRRYVIVKTDKKWYAEVAQYEKDLDFIPVGSGADEELNNAILFSEISLNMTLILSKE